MIPSGMMHTQITISRPTQSLDELGEGVVSPSIGTTVVGHVESQHRKDSREDMALAAQGTMQVVIPWLPDTKLGDQITISDSSMQPSTEVWEITAIEDDRMRHRWLRITAIRQTEQT